MVEGARLESVYAGNRIAGSNPAPSATSEQNCERRSSGRVLHSQPALPVWRAPNNASSYISADLAKWIDGQNMEHVRAAPYHPMTHGRIERWHLTLKSRILIETYCLPAISMRRSRTSSPTTTTGAITRASTIRRQPTSTSAAARHSHRTGKDQTTEHNQSPLAAPSESRMTSQTRRARASLILSRRLS